MQCCKKFMKILKINNHLKITVYSWISKVISAALQFLNLKLFLVYLGIDNYALIVVLINVQSYFMIMDMSIGYGLQNYFTKAVSKSKNVDIVGSTALFITILTILILGGVACISSNFITKFLFSNLQATSVNLNSLFIFSACIFMANAFANLSTRILYATHQGHIPNILTAIANITSIILVLLITKFSNFNELKLFISIAIITLPNVLLSLTALVLLAKKYNFSILKVKLRIIKILYCKSIYFWIIGLLALFILQVDYLILAQTVTPSDIVTYNILSKIYSVFYILFTTALLTLWPILTQEYHKNNFQEMKAYIRKYLYLGFIFYIIVGIIVLISKDFILEFLAKGTITLTVQLILFYTLYQVIAIWVGMFATVLQSIDDTKFLAIWTFIQALITIPLEYYLSLHYGVLGLILALIISFSVTGAIALPLRVKYKLRMGN